MWVNNQYENTSSPPLVMLFTYPWLVNPFTASKLNESARQVLLSSEAGYIYCDFIYWVGPI